jgi:hypothetical protein
MLLLGLFLQLPISQHRAPRAVFGVMLAASMLVTHPKIYASHTQMMGLTLACYCCELAWTILHWTFLETGRKPTISEVCVSPIQHLAHGVRKAHQRSQQLLQQDSKPGCKPWPVVLVHADEQGACVHAAQSASHLPLALVCLVLKAAERLLLVCFVYDLVQYTLCTVLAPQMCADGGSLLAASGGIFSTPVATAAVAADWLERLSAHLMSYLQLCLFGIDDGNRVCRHQADLEPISSGLSCSCSVHARPAWSCFQHAMGSCKPYRAMGIWVAPVPALLL